MVKGHPRNQVDADPILDELVRTAFLFLQDHPTHVAARQPGYYDVLEQSDKELTEALKQGGLLSGSYAAVLSGTSTKPGDAFDGGIYRLVVYNTAGGGSEKDGVNVNLQIRLNRGTEPGISHAVGEYTVDGNRAVFFEEVKGIVEGWSGKPRQISIAGDTAPNSLRCEAGRVPSSPESEIPQPDDVLAYHDSKTPLDGAGKPIPDSLFPSAKSRLLSHPQGTSYEADKFQILCFFPKGKE
ncbi:hypothetical protein HYU13_03970 [Candidatus Woesearchaeota archaeon]|nr:hypothetical protein [Candidatus Woesearchaeota archaeon]